jgi:Thymidine kinase
MFSGKTDALIGDYRDAVAEGVPSIAIKPELDTRHPQSEIVSHSGARIPAVAIRDTSAVAAVSSAAARVFVDEIQFFDERLITLIDALRNQGRNVVASGLDLDFRRKEFRTTAAVAASASRVRSLAARCGICGRAASLTQRLVDGRPAPLAQPAIMVGDRELYEARCALCWERERAGDLESNAL